VKRQPAPAMSFGETMQVLCKQKRVKYINLADKIGVDRSAISRYIWSERIPDRYHLKEIIRALNLTPEETLQLVVAWYTDPYDSRAEKYG
jgi:transcriptional regulator with XRE-family HTH domain